MKSIIYILSILAITYQISGCVQKIVAPGAESLTNETSAYFKPDNKFSWGGIYTTLIAVYPIASGPLVESKPFVDYSQIKITPGTYKVLLKTTFGNATAYPVARVEAKPGKTYLFTGKTVMDGAAVKAEYKEIDTTE